MRQIQKRDGSLVEFNSQKITNAIFKANEATGQEPLSQDKLAEIVESVVQAIPADGVPTVEQVQDIVEEKLINAGFAKTAKAYILYRAEHAKMRRAENDLMTIYQDLTFREAKEVDLKRENANIDANTSMGTMLKYGSEGSKYFVNNYLLPKEIMQAHVSGDIHIHDQDFYMLTETCCQIDLLKLFDGGFFTGHGALREPNDIRSYAALACIAIQANQNEMHGGQSVPNFDYSMEPGVKKTFQKQYSINLSRYFRLMLHMSLQAADQLAHRLRKQLKGVISMTCGEQLESQLVELLKEQAKQSEPFSISEEQAKQAHQFAFESAWNETDKATYQAMEALIHNLNTMNSRAGAQVPFSSINYGTCTSEEGRMVIRNLLLATSAGLGNGETPIFPVQIFKVKQGVSYDLGDPNYDLFKLAMKTSAKRLFPNFSFLDAPFNLAYYDGSYNSEVAYMGCRTRVMGNVHDPSREVTCGRGNLSFTSINLPRIGIQANGDLEKFYKMLDSRIDLCIRQLMHRFEIQSKKKVFNYPFLMGQGVWIDSETLDPDQTVGEVLKHGTLSVGFIGLAETLVALTGEHHGQSEKSQQLGLEIVEYMRKRLDKESQRTHLNFTLLATPAEGLSGRFVRMDQKKFGKIKGITDRGYYTNSFHVPVYFPINAFQKIRIEAPYHAFTNAGHISYVELDGDACKNMEAFEAIIRCMKEAGIGYGSVNHPVDRDPICGYNGVIDNVCPRCGRKEGEAVSVEKLKELRKKFPDMPIIPGCGCDGT